MKDNADCYTPTDARFQGDAMSLNLEVPATEQHVEEVARLLPEFLQDPIDAQMSAGGNAVFVVIDEKGLVRGRIFGTDKAKTRWSFGIAHRKAIQVWSTGYATGRFEELVYGGQLDESRFGINRPDFIGWPGGVPLLLPDGSLIAAAFSGFRGKKDVEIVERAAASIPVLRVKKD
jgi:uncharacterized protein GlcG (DUF336 family)